MSKQPHWCPVCDFGGGATLASVRSHFNAATSEGHDWDRLREQVENQEVESAGELLEADESSLSEQPESDPEGAGTDGSDDEEGEPSGEQTEGGETPPSVAADSGSEMATQEEYEQQQQRQQQESSDEGSKKGETSGDSPSGSEQSPTASESSGFHVPNVSGRALLLVAGLLLVAFIAWRVLGGDDVEYENPEENADGDDDSRQMVDVDAGTGGVMT